MKKRIWFILLFYILLISNRLVAQYHLDVEGHARIRGNIDLQHHLDSTSLYIGKSAGESVDTMGASDIINNELRRYNTYLGYGVGRNSNKGQYNTCIGAISSEDIEGSFNSFLGTNTGPQNKGNSNTFIGSASGFSNTSGGHNSFLGISSGQANQHGSANTFLGAYAGSSNDSADYNVHIGFQTGQFTRGEMSEKSTYIGANAAQVLLYGTENTFLGAESGRFLRNGDFNTLVGVQAGAGNNSDTMDYCTFVGYHSGLVHHGSPSTFVGAFSGSKNTSGEQNTFIGTSSGLNSSTGNENTFVGHTAGFKNNSGNRNSFFGVDAGREIVQGNYNICVGRAAGPTADTSYTLYIDVEKTNKPLIYGEFDHDLVRIHGNLQTEKNQAVLRMESLNHNNGSVLVLRNSTANPNTVGAINFENNSGQTRGQIDYQADNELAFRVDFVNEMMKLSNTANHIIMSNGATLTAGGVWTDNCSAALKNLQYQMNGEEVLDQIQDLPIYYWSYKKQPEENHLGPTAEDFYAAFGLGVTDKKLAGVDLGGVALSAIQALAKENEMLKRELAEIKELLGKN